MNAATLGSGICSRRLTLPAAGGVMTRMLRLGRRQLVTARSGAIAVDRLTCRVGWLARRLRCLRDRSKRELCPSLVIERTLLMTIARMLDRKVFVPDASRRNSDLGAATRTLGGPWVTWVCLDVGALVAWTVAWTLWAGRFDVVVICLTLISGVCRPCLMLAVRVCSGETHSMA